MPSKEPDSAVWHCPQDGGALLVDAAAAVTLDGCSLSRNTAAAAGGSVMCKRCSKLEIKASRFAESQAGSAAGAVSCSACGSVLLQQASFLKCSAAAGGAVHGSAGSFVVEGTRFQANR
jgi:hypothetical protein